MRKIIRHLYRRLNDVFRLFGSVSACLFVYSSNLCISARPVDYIACDLSLHFPKNDLLSTNPRRIVLPSSHLVS